MARGLPVTAMVHMTFNTPLDHFMERSNLIDALLQNTKPWPPAVENKFLDYWERAKSHTDMMTYQTGDGVFEILTFARDGRGGNVHAINAKRKICSCEKWKNYHMSCSHCIKFCDIRGIEPNTYVIKYYSTKLYKQTYSSKFYPVDDERYWQSAPFALVANVEYMWTSSVGERTRLKNDMDISPARMARKCSIYKETGHTKARCPRRAQ